MFFSTLSVFMMDKVILDPIKLSLIASFIPLLWVIKSIIVNDGLAPFKMLSVKLAMVLPNYLAKM